MTEERASEPMTRWLPMTDVPLLGQVWGCSAGVGRVGFTRYPAPGSDAGHPTDQAQLSNAMEHYHCTRCLLQLAETT